MLFNSTEFIFVFLPVAVLVHFALARVSASAALLGTTLSSLLFYAWWSPPFVLLPVVSIVANFWFAGLIAAAHKPASKQLLIAAIAANLIVLCYWKYADFLLSMLQARPSVPQFVPLALSFTTFVQVAFLVDVYRRNIPLHFGRYAFFVVFFPHLIAGPIVRWNTFGRQLGDPARFNFDWSNVALGLTIFVLGLGKKVLIADSLSPHVGVVFDATAKGDPVTAVAAWGAALAFSAQIYFDFSGYSDMAIGLGLLFNFRLPVNFAAPLRATNILDFWRRWHITLSQWLRDYIYGPLTFGRPMGWWRAFAVMVTMTLAGLWHGAGWTFMVWGAYHGSLLIINTVWQRVTPERKEPTRAGQLAGWAITFTAFVVGAVFFRAADLDTSWRLLLAMGGLGAPPVAEAITLQHDWWAIREGWISEIFIRTWLGSTWSATATALTVLALAIALLVPDTLEITGYREADAQSRWRRRAGPLAWQPSLIAGCIILLLFAEVFLRLGQASEFLYFQF